MAENQIAWTLIAVLPIALFIALFTILSRLFDFDGIGDSITKKKSGMIKTILLNIGLAKEIPND